MHPAGLRCSSLTYARYARSSRLAGRAPRRPECKRYSFPGPWCMTRLKFLDFAASPLARRVRSMKDALTRRSTCRIMLPSCNNSFQVARPSPISRPRILREEGVAMRGFVRGLAVLAVLVLAPAAAFAQATITGTVKDSSGGILPGVTVEAIGPRPVESSQGGRHRRHWHLPDHRSPPGTYRCRSRCPGSLPSSATASS